MSSLEERLRRLETFADRANADRCACTGTRPCTVDDGDVILCGVCNLPLEPGLTIHTPAGTTPARLESFSN